ncbi:DUF4488 domain-containing protein [Sphingobacterium griseoflavum]|uniref:DUF4488 domain-containing protein n=1 Tax=Sphingobacterium griseoflavum TaxID=1474952 RepID=A0ABQ3HW23_9SPHI|nr:DUF4488 domain-containing protein [Sphingobacterium griseoflavum]GHE30269.1 hypothetical protein GCM10017764_11480 [Sphingobacterium griseoflavum]
MKKIKIILTQLLLLACCAAVAVIPPSSKKKITSRFIGVWELASMEGPDGQTYHAHAGQLKCFETNGNYRFLFVSNGGTVVTQQGSFKVVSDKMYAENIEFSTNPNLRNVSSPVTFAFVNEDTLQLSGSVNNVPFQEKWVRVKMPAM